jgi:hypothetical protein
MKKIYLIPAYFIVSFSAFVAPVARAETHITDYYSFSPAASWTKEGSPYILDGDIYVPAGQALTVGPGVTVTTSSSSPGSLYVGGLLDVDGTSEQPVTIKNLTGFGISFSTSTISHAIIDVPTGLDVTKSYLIISSSTITDADKGIDVRGSTMNIIDSRIFGNNYGIYSDHMPPPVFQVINAIFGTSMAYAQTDEDIPNENHITVSNSSIVDNGSYVVFDSIINVVNAKNDWWGSPTGPIGATSTLISGNVNFAPWLTKDPTVSSSPAVCCSNVLFLPGLESSRLYLDKKTFLGTSTNELWEPNRNDDVRKLFMTSTGQSINAGIYTKDVIDSALGLFPIYKALLP